MFCVPLFQSEAIGGQQALDRVCSFDRLLTVLYSLLMYISKRYHQEKVSHAREENRDTVPAGSRFRKTDLHFNANIAALLRITTVEPGTRFATASYYFYILI